jgi:hypothetical protein
MSNKRWMAWIFLIVGAAAICFGFVSLVRSLQCKGWPVVTGVIRTGEIKEKGGGEGGSTYTPHISYEYTANGSRFTAEKIAFGMASGSMSDGQTFLRSYPIGKTVLVHYNPSDPSEAVLDTAMHGGMWSNLSGGTVFVLVALLFLKFTKPVRSTESTVRS